jgi:hypothetical protein
MVRGMMFASKSFMRAARRALELLARWRKANVAIWRLKIINGVISALQSAWHRSESGGSNISSQQSKLAQSLSAASASASAA